MQKVNGVNWYRPREIARLGLIQNSKGTDKEDSTYNFIIEQIKVGRLIARNYSTSEKHNYWLVSEQEIKKFHEKTN